MSEDPGAIRADESGSRPTIQDVARGYQRFLGRELESVAIAGGHIAGSPTLWDLVDLFYGCPEARRLRVGEACADVQESHRQPRTDLAASPAELDALYALTFAAWRDNGLGRHDHWLRRNERPYEARSNRWHVASALERGRGEAEALLRCLERYGLRPAMPISVAVLGVEAYRLIRGLGPISSRMDVIEALEKDIRQIDVATESLDLNNISVSSVATIANGLSEYDLIYAVGALQYMPPPMMMDIVRRLLKAMRPNGVTVLQIPSYLYGYDYHTSQYLAGEGRDPTGEIHAIDQASMLELLCEEGFVPLEVVPDGGVTPFGIAYQYIARKM
ncbi:MAG: hypothetical protein J7498_01865 [Sphingobium sp.]|nr:hypothetical protein [Sphingobium sp.]